MSPVRRFLPLVATFTATALFALYGCDTGEAGSVQESGSAQAQSVDPIDPCSLLTQEEVNGALGQATAPPERQDMPAGYVPEGAPIPVTSMCNWYGEWPHSVGLIVQQSGRVGDKLSSVDFAARENESVDQQASEPDLAESTNSERWAAVEMEGHAAIERSNDGENWTVMARAHGERAVTIALTTATRDIGIELARIALTRIP